MSTTQDSVPQPSYQQLQAENARLRADIEPLQPRVAELEWLLRAHLTDPDNARLCRLLQKHRARLLPFLYGEGVAATNNRAERALRPAVIARKLSAGNHPETGAQTHAILASVIQTCRQQGQDFLGWAQQVLRSPEPMTLPLAGAVSALPP